jgi:hypothetical protein
MIAVKKEEIKWAPTNDAVWDAIDRVSRQNDAVWDAIEQLRQKLVNIESAVRIFREMLVKAKIPPFDYDTKGYRNFAWRQNAGNTEADTYIVNMIIDHFNDNLNHFGEAILKVSDFDDICLLAKDEHTQNQLKGDSNGSD